MNGGPAFPSHGTMGEVAEQGMTLRDYFAAAALQGLIAHNTDCSPVNVARASYIAADAMLLERAK